MKKKVYVGFEPYKTIVEALANPEIEIEWPTFWRNEGYINERCVTTNSIRVCSTSQTLLAIGFSQNFVYDRTHFEVAMMPEMSDIEHAHDLSISELLSLPEKLNNPLFIAVAKERIGTTGDKTQRLESIYYDKDSRSFYKMVIAPNIAEGNPLNMNGYTNKVITFFKMDGPSLNTFFRDITSEKRELVFYDKSKIPESDLDLLPADLAARNSFAVSIRGKTTALKMEIGNAGRTKFVEDVVTYAAGEKVAGVLNIDSFRSNTLDSAIELANSATSYHELIVANKMFNALRPKMTDYATKYITFYEKLIADKYAKLTKELGPKYKESIEKELADCPVYTEGDVDRMYDLADELEKKIPTLKNLGITLDIAQDAQAAAQEVSSNLYRATKDSISEITMDKEDKFIGHDPT